MQLYLALIPEQRIAGINRDVKGKLRLYCLMFDECRQEEQPACRSVSELASSVSFLWPNTVTAELANRTGHHCDSLAYEQNHEQAGQYNHLPATFTALFATNATLLCYKHEL